MDAIELPIPSELIEIIEVTPSGNMTFLITDGASRSRGPASATGLATGATMRPAPL
jgi:hypothetical protein